MSTKTVKYKVDSKVFFCIDVPEGNKKHEAAATHFLSVIAKKHMADSSYIAGHFVAKKTREGYSTMATKFRNAGKKVGFSSEQLVEAFMDKSFCDNVEFEVTICREKVSKEILMNVRLKDSSLKLAFDLMKDKTK